MRGNEKVRGEIERGLMMTDEDLGERRRARKQRDEGRGSRAVESVSGGCVRVLGACKVWVCRWLREETKTMVILYGVVDSVKV